MGLITTLQLNMALLHQFTTMRRHWLHPMLPFLFSSTVHVTTYWSDLPVSSLYWAERDIQPPCPQCGQKRRKGKNNCSGKCRECLNFYSVFRDWFAEHFAFTQALHFCMMLTSFKSTVHSYSLALTSIVPPWLCPSLSSSAWCSFLSCVQFPLRFFCA